MQCPNNSFNYNTTQCSCNPGYIFNTTTKTCYLFSEWGPVEIDSGVDYTSISFPGSGSLFDFDSIRKLTQSQAVFLEATLVMLLSWLCFCFFARCAPLGDGRSSWFKIVDGLVALMFALLLDTGWLLSCLPEAFQFRTSFCDFQSEYRVKITQRGLCNAKG